MEKKRTEEKMKKSKKKKVNGGEVTVVTEETKLAKLKASLKDNKDRVIAGGLTILVLGTAVVCYFINRKPKNNGKDLTSSVTDVVKEEEYSRELLDTRVKSFATDANNKGINLTEEQALEFAAVLNLEQIVNEDPELAKKLFGGKNPEDVLTDSGHVIGILMTNSFKNGYKTPMNLSTLVVGNDYDRNILKTLEGYRDQLTTMRAEGQGEHRVEFATKEEEEKFNTIITDVLNFYSMTADGLNVEGNNAVIQPMSDGARFLTVLVMNEIALGNKNLLTDEQYTAFQELMSNEPVVANIQNIIAGCQKTKTK